MLQPQAREKAEKEGFEVSVAKSSFKANSKALAENEGEGLAKVAFLNLFVVEDPFVDILSFVNRWNLIILRQPSSNV